MRLLRKGSGTFSVTPFRVLDVVSDRKRCLTLICERFPTESQSRMLARFQFLGLIIVGAAVCGAGPGDLGCGAAVAGGVRPPARTAGGFTTGYHDPVVAFINDEIRKTWDDNEVRPSRVADDAEWLRRVFLDIVGHIPPAAEIDAFVRSRDDAKRAEVVERLLADPDYVHNWTNIWTNLLLGRQTPRRTSREGMEKFLREAVTRNRPWNQIVHDLLTAEGRDDEDGAVNFLMGQLSGNPNREDYTVEATARSTRLFLGTQVQCTQCHNHPFNEWRQAQFWEFDSFFRQMRRVDHRKTDPDTGLPVDDYSELVWKNYSGPVHFEKRSGVMEVAYPFYEDREIDPSPQTDRRQELAKVLALEDVGQQVARAMVNRMWGHFMGFGFTRPVDDMGPHNPPSHPGVLDRLTQEFAAADYDLQQLIRWIANCEAYHLTSRRHDGNRTDDPAAGEIPLFSHMAVKPFTAEQLYDSLLVAAQAGGRGASNRDAAGRKTASRADVGGEMRNEMGAGYAQSAQQRRQWMREFLLIFGGNEQDEPTNFDGSIPQALMMMNGPLVQQALQTGTGGTLHAVLSNKQLRSDRQRIRSLYLASLGRRPSRRESTAAQSMITASNDKMAAYQDLFWALLNSNEFVFNH